MKKQRKIISALLVLIMIMATGFVMSGCGEEDPVEVYKKASDNLNAADDFSFDGKINMNIKSGGQEMKITMDMDGDYIKSKSDDPLELQMAMNMKMDMLGQSNEMKMYIKDGYTYTDDGTSKAKAKLEKDSADQIKKAMETKFEIDKYVKKSSMDGDTVKLTVDGKKMMAEAMDKFKDSLEDAGNSTVDSYTEMIEKAGIDEIKVEAVVKDDNFTSFKMDMPMKIDMGTGQKTDTDIVIDLSDIKVNSGLKDIEIPDISQFK